jgi:hypothetical protein
MANFDGPLFEVTVGSFREAGYESDNHFVVFWTEQPTFAGVGLGGGGGGGGGEAPVNGYGYSHSG